MKGFSNVLVPLDFSEASEQVLRTALRVLEEGGRLTLLHVVEWMPAVTEGTFGVYAHRHDIDRLRQGSKERLQEYARAHPGIDFAFEIHEGKPAGVILDVAARLKPDLVVIGTHGRSRLDHLLIGSVAERVLRKSSGHVLAVRA
jgi:nucleotide-binding universal stress UspA family protein